MSCEDLRSRLETYLDGELPSHQTLELQVHLDTCSECAESVAFSQAIRQSARHLVQRDTVVTDAFRARLKDALLAEARAEDAKAAGARGEAPRAGLWQKVYRGAPRAGLAILAVAAAALLWIDHGRPLRAEADSTRNTLITAMGPDELLDKLIDFHTAPPRPLLTGATLVPELERDVGVKVPFPNSLTQYGAEWEGGSVIRVRRDQPAAYLRYRTADAHNVTVYVYNASRMPLHAGLKPRMFREEPVYEGYRRGYAIAAQLRHGVGYAVASDLDEPLSAELVRAIARSAVTH
jgi:anti-sigma factor RsiW